MRIAPVRLAACLLLSTVAAASACGGGSPASPTFTPPTSDAGDPAGDPAGNAEDVGASLLADASPEAVAAAFARCAASPATGSFPTDVAAVLTAKCQPCHRDPPVNGAPFPLLTYPDVHKLFGGAIPIYQEMYMLIQPGGNPHMPFGKAPQLTPEEFATLSGWLISCAPPGN